MHSRSHLCGSDSLPWLECPCRDSYTLGTWDHTDTSSHCPYRWTPLLNYRQYSSELPGQNVLADTQAVWPEDLKEREYYVINAKGCSRQASFPTYVTKKLWKTIWLFGTIYTSVWHLYCVIYFHASELISDVFLAFPSQYGTSIPVTSVFLR